MISYGKVYLDNAATTRVLPKVVMAMLPYFDVAFGNPGSVHKVGRDAEEAVAKARCRVAKPIGAAVESIVFTAGGSEANNLALIGVAETLVNSGKFHVVMSNIEHESVLACASILYDRYGIEVSFAEAEKSGIVSVEQIKRVVKPYTGLVSIMAVNNELGTRNPIGEIGSFCHENGILFHTDCVQAYCNTKINVDTDNIDFLSVSGHKFHAPKGVGFLYAKDRSLLTAIIHGGGQEGGLRSGTENVPCIVGIGKAAEISYQKMGEMADHYHELTECFLDELKSRITGVHLNGTPFYGSKTLNLRFDDIDGETLLLMLDGQGICVSAGSACSAHSAKPSHVLNAIGLTDEQARASIRVSISNETTKEDLLYTAEVIAESVGFLRGR